MLMATHEPWGICIPPPARLRDDPLPAGWTKFGGHAMRVPEHRALLADGLPAERDLAWWPLTRQIVEAFRMVVGQRLVRPPRGPDLRVAHPLNAAQIEALRAVYNGELPEPEGGCLPRVWRWEHQEQTWWLVELPPHLEWAWRSLGV